MRRFASLQGGPYPCGDYDSLVAAWCSGVDVAIGEPDLAVPAPGGERSRVAALATRSAMDPDAVVLEGVDVERGGVPVLRDANLSVPAAAVVGVTGRNGSGKSTLLAVLATLVRPVRGRVSVLGRDVSAGGVSRSLRSRIGYVAHEPALHPGRTIREELTLVATLRGRGHDEVEAALTRVGLAGAAGRRVAHCSQGMRRRADLARAALGDPELLLLDEADSGLDPEATAAVAELIADVRGRGGATVVVGHDPARLAATCDTVWTVRAGRLEALA